MKRKISGVLGFTMMAAFILIIAYCDVMAADIRAVSLATATSKGVFYQNGIAIGYLSEKGLIPGIKVYPQASGGSSDNVNLLENKQVDFAMVHNSTGVPAYLGTGPFKGNPRKSLRVVSAIWRSVLHFPVRKDAKIQSIADYRGKKVQIGPIGSGIEKFTLQPLSVYGIGPEDVKAVRLSVAECIQQIKNGQIDAFVHGSIVPDANISELMLTGRVKLISMEPKKVKELMSEYPMYAPASIPPNVYHDQDYRVDTAASFALLMTYADQDEEVVYAITKAIHENHDFLVSLHSSFKDTTLENALLGMGPIPLHLGAEKYYKEIGILK